MKDINTRTLQDILRAEQVRLSTTKHSFMRKVIMQRISKIAAELLYRWRSETQVVGV